MRHAPLPFVLSFALLAALVVAPAPLAGCAKGPAFAHGVYDAGSRVRYRIGVPPEAWQRIDVEEGQVAYVFPSLGATLSAHAECNNTGAPLRALTTHVLIGMTERKVVSESQETLAGRESLRTRLTAKVDGVAQELEVVVVKKDGCNFDFVYSAPPERFSERRADFQRFVTGFEKLSSKTSGAEAEPRAQRRSGGGRAEGGPGRAVGAP